MPRKVIDLDETAANVSVLSYGATKTGKTRFMASLPKPLLITQSSTRGSETVRALKQICAEEAFYDAKTPPVIWEVDNSMETLAAIAEVEAMLKKDPTVFRSVVIDDLSYYADSWMTQWVMDQGAKSFDMRKAYGDLHWHMSYLVDRCHAMPVHMGWTASERGPEEAGVKGGILVGSKRTGEMMPGKINYVFYHEASGTGESQKYNIHTRPYGVYAAGGRDAGQLPAILPEHHFRNIEEFCRIKPFLARPEKASRESAVAEEVADQQVVSQQKRRSFVPPKRSTEVKQ